MKGARKIACNLQTDYESRISRATSSLLPLVAALNPTIHFGPTISSFYIYDIRSRFKKINVKISRPRCNGSAKQCLSGPIAHEMS